MEAVDQRLIDQRLVDLDGTPDKSRLGANALLGVSLAVAKAAAESAGLELFRYVGGPNAHVLPVPMMNIINGGAHADSSVDVQEFMIAPIGADSFREALRWGAEVYHALKSVLKAQGAGHRARRRGRLRPGPARHPRRAGPDRQRRREGRVRRGPDIVLALDVAATEFYYDGAYSLRGRQPLESPACRLYADLVDGYPLVSIEDPLSEDDWDGWIALTRPIGDRVQLVGDDLFVTNPERLEEGIARGRGERAAGQGQPDRHAHGDPRRRRARAPPATAA